MEESIGYGVGAERVSDLSTVAQALRTRVFRLNLLCVCATCYTINLLILYLNLTDTGKHGCCNDIGIFTSVSVLCRENAGNTVFVDATTSTFILSFIISMSAFNSAKLSVRGVRLQTDRRCCKEQPSRFGSTPPLRDDVLALRYTPCLKFKRPLLRALSTSIIAGIISLPVIYAVLMPFGSASVHGGVYLIVKPVMVTLLCAAVFTVGWLVSIQRQQYPELELQQEQDSRVPLIA